MAWGGGVAHAASAILLAGIVIALLLSPYAYAAAECAPTVARIESVQGRVELRRARAATWQEAQPKTALCAGDTVRVGARARAALLLANETTLRLDQNTSLTVSGVDEAKASLLDLFLGTVHVITRTPKPFKIRTPFVNAGVEGTEFLVAVSAEETRIAVFEGQVSAANDFGSLMLVSGEIAIAARNLAPRKERLIRPTDAVQWALYYPTIIDYRLDERISGAAAEPALRESIELYRQGRLAEAIFRLDNVPESIRDPRFLTYRAGLLLLVGRADEAGSDIERALAQDPGNSNAHALQSIVAVVQNDKTQALKLATRAVELDESSPVARIALSYAQQAHFKIEEALATVQRAVELDPQNALVWARLAELHMSTGYLDRALEAAQRAVALNPDLSKTQSVLGFANLTRIDTQAAKEAFRKAIELDQADPLPRLGLGLARIREGDLTAGREEIEIAVSLDPENSLLRSYVGKAYYEEKRDKLAGIQFELAKERDPRDPTPWFYDAIRKQSENRLVDALRDLNTSIQLNDNRAVYRSQLLLDDDRAARSASLATLYGEVGFERLAILEGVKGTTDNPGNFSAHRLLASAYVDTPRRDIARVSEGLQATLRQPVHATSLDPQISTDNLFILRDAGPSRVSANEFNWLFARDQTRFLADAIVGNRDTLGEQILLSGLKGDLAFSLGQFAYETNGFRDNNSLVRNIYEFFSQAQATRDTTLQVALKRSSFDVGRNFFSFDPDLNFRLKVSETSDTFRVGGHHLMSASSDIIWSAIHENKDRLITTVEGGFTVTKQDTRSDSLEVQHLARSGQFNLLTGLGSLKGDTTSQDSPGRQESSNLYSYLQWNAPSKRVSVQLGLAAESVKIQDELIPASLTRSKINPKLGLIWNPSGGTTIRGAVFSSVRRPLIQSQTIEPTQVAGFVQFLSGIDRIFGEFDGTVSRQVGFAIDQKLGASTFVGVEVQARRSTVPFLSPRQDFEWKESSARAYLYSMSRSGANFNTLREGRWQWATTVEYEYENIDRLHDFTGAEGIIELTTHRVPFGIMFFDPTGMALRAKVTYVKQDGRFSADTLFPVFPKSDSAWVTDVSLDYRFRRRLGVLSIGAKNMFNKSLDLVETDLANPRVAVGRFVFGRLRLSF